MRKRNDYGKGNREVGHLFHIRNFNTTTYKRNQALGEDHDCFSDVLLWSLGEIEYMGDLEYNSADNGMVPDRLPDVVYEKYFSHKAVILYIVGAACLAMSLFFMSLFYINRKSKVITASQPLMSMLILVGGFFIAGRVINAALRISDATCSAGLWLGHLGFSLIFGALFIKMWRVHKLINNGLKRVKITERYVVVMTLVSVLVMFVYLCVMMWVGKPRAVTICTVAHNRRDCMMRCHFDYDEFHSALFVVEGLLVLYGGYMCYLIKGAPEAVNESKHNGQGKCAMCVT
jgi:hypothetical protein